jgi:hypothetical protein
LRKALDLVRFSPRKREEWTFPMEAFMTRNPKLKSAFIEMPPSNFPEGTVSDL